ncbi:hypothetical protein ACFP3U_23600 [Kitasatospora misakiensis]|uniref:Lipoprotein n=1 Tax=Kitasatospora misakiensis TaxID=67330 RepID=A0ABW0X5X4_9ACTN
MATLALAGCSAVSGSGDLSSADKARIEYCAGLGSQMMVMMQISSGGGKNLIPERVAESAQRTISAAEEVERSDPKAPTTLAEDTKTFLTQSNNATAAGPALTRTTSYCKSHGLDPMGSASK